MYTRGMKVLKKKLLSFVLTLFGLFMMPMMVFADETNPITKIKEYFKLDWKILDGLGFLFLIIMIPVTLILIIVLVWSIIGVIMHLLKIKRGKAKIKDKEFWIETAAIFIILFLIFSGAFFSFLENLYEWTNKQDIGESVTYQIEQPISEYYDWTGKEEIAKVAYQVKQSTPNYTKDGV